MLNLPANFETYAEARKSSFMKMKEIKDNGGLLLFCSSGTSDGCRCCRCAFMRFQR